MGRPVSLFIVVLLCPSLLRPLSSQEVATDSDSDSPTSAAVTTVAPEEAGDLSTDSDEVQTLPPTVDGTTHKDTPVEVTTPPSTSTADSAPDGQTTTTPDDQTDQAEQVTTSLPIESTSTEAETTTAPGLTTALSSETTTTPQPTTEGSSLVEAQTTGTTDGPTTSLSTTVFPTTSKTTSSTPPPPTTPGTTQSSSTPTTPKATTVEDTTEATTTLAPTTVVTPLVLLQSSPGTHVASITPFAVGAPPGQKNDDQSNMPLWLWIVIAALVAMLVGAVCVALLVQRRKKRTDHVFGGMNGRSQRSKKKKGEDDVWAGPVLMAGEGNNCEGKGGDGDHVEGNGGGGLAEMAAEPMLSSFAPSDEEKAVGADGTKEARRWSERSPLLYIDEDAEEVKPTKEEAQPPVFSQDGGSAGKTEEGGAGQQETGGTLGETSEVLNGGVAFCQTTAV